MRDGDEISRYVGRDGVLSVVKTADDHKREIYVAIDSDGQVTAFNGHVDLGTGIGTALTQIVAEELDVGCHDVRIVLGHTDLVPDQGPTIASETIQVAAEPLRRAAATARGWLVAEAAKRLGCDVDTLKICDGLIIHFNESLPLGDLIKGRAIVLELDTQASLKPISEYRIVGRSHPRLDLPFKATGTWTYVHDVRVPGMLHGRVVRPPYAGIDAGGHVGHSLRFVDTASVAHLPGLVRIVTIGDFVGIVALREEQAEKIARTIKVEWGPYAALPDLNAPEDAIRGNTSTTRRLLDRGDVDRSLANSAKTFQRTYVWPYQMHGSIGPSCAVADVRGAGATLSATIWSGTQNPVPLQKDIALLLDVEVAQIRIQRMEASGCYGRNCADDVAADAALLSSAVGRPVRVQLTREQEHAWEPKGAAQVVDVHGGLDDEGGPSAYAFETRYPSNHAPTLALLLTGRVAAEPVASTMGDRTAIPPYAFPNARITVHDMPAIVRASWFRGVSALPNTFAHECFIDELAFAAGVDPIEYRLRYLPDDRARDLIRSVAQKADWIPRTKVGTSGGKGDLLFGRGFAYAVYVHGPFPGKAAAWAAWIADVAVNKITGDIAVTKVTAAQDAGLMINPDGVRHQIHGNVIQSTSRTLKEQVGFDQSGVQSLDWGTYPILQFPDLPEIDVLMIERPDQPPLGVGESTSVPSAAAIANAVFDATGIRFRELPLTPERVRAALNPLPSPKAEPKVRGRRWWRAPFAGAASVLAGALSLSSLLIGSHEIQAIEPLSKGLFSEATIERGRQLAGLGACNVCHIGDDGRAFAGGRALATPFGTIYASNITPDPNLGIGRWSFEAFERAMRQGVSRSGQNLYPAHPYTSFAGAKREDLESIYAFLMAQPASSNDPPTTRLRFPFGVRSLMMVWNAAFHQSPTAETPLDTAVARGRYLVETLGHCSACHSPRNAFGAEKRGINHLSGSVIDSYWAPPLTSASPSPVKWDEDAYFNYLRYGAAPLHGVAGGPMAAVVESLADLPDAEVRDMAAYLASLNKSSEPAVTAESHSTGAQADDDAYAKAAIRWPRVDRLFETACASCHMENDNIGSLKFNTSLNGEIPRNVIMALLHGCRIPALKTSEARTQMPAFASLLDDRQVEDLVRYLRARFAPQRTSWTHLASLIREVRAESPHAGNH